MSLKFERTMTRSRTNTPRNIFSICYCMILLLLLFANRGMARSTSVMARPRSRTRTSISGNSIHQQTQQQQQSRSRQHQQQQQQQREMESGPPRRLIDPFTVLLSPISTTLTYSQANTVRDTVEGLLQTYFQSNVTWSDPQTSVTYIGLAQILSNVQTDDGTGVLVTMNGLVYFQEGSVNVPSESDLLTMIQNQALTPDALTEALLPFFPTLQLAEVTATETTSNPTEEPIVTPSPEPTQEPVASPTTAPYTPPPVIPNGIIEDGTNGNSSSSDKSGGMIGGIVAALAVVVLIVAVVFWVHRKKSKGAAVANRSKATTKGEDDEVVFQVDEEHGFQEQDWGWKPKPSPASGVGHNLDYSANVGNVGGVVVASSATAVTSPTASTLSSGDTNLLSNGSNGSHTSNVSPDKTVSTAETEGDMATPPKVPQHRSVPSPMDTAPHSPAQTTGSRSSTDNQTAAAITRAGTASAMSFWTSLFQMAPSIINNSNNPSGVLLEEIHSVASSDLLGDGIDDDGDDDEFDVATDGEGTLSDFDDAISIQPHIVSVNSLESFEEHHQRSRGDFVVKKDMLESSIVNANPNGLQRRGSDFPKHPFNGDSLPRRTTSPSFTTMVPASHRDGLAFAPYSTSPSGAARGGGPSHDLGESDSDDDQWRQRAMMPNPYVHRRPYNVNDMMGSGNVVDRSSSCALEPTDMSAATLAKRQGQLPPPPMTNLLRPQQQPEYGNKSQNMIPKLAQAWWASRSSSSATKRRPNTATNTSLDGSLNQSGEDDTFDGGMDDAWDPDSELSSLGTAPTEDEMNSVFQTRVENKKEQSIMNHSLRNESNKRQLLRTSPTDGRSSHSQHDSDGESAWSSEI